MADYDLLIRGVRVVDGTGNPWFRNDVAVAGGKIAGVGRFPPRSAAREIEADGLVLAPGFVDMHSHADFYLLVEPLSLGKILQGVTTEVIGNCGMSAAPASPQYLPQLQAYMSFLTAGEQFAWDWVTMEDYLCTLSGQELGINAAAFIGQGSVRIAVMGMDDREPTAAELEQMKALVGEGMRAGAVGLSSGLVYPPGVYSRPEEIAALCQVVARHGGIYQTHMRNESNKLVESVQETIHIGEASGAPVNIAHHKICGQVNWGLSGVTLALVDQARERGLDVTLDQYPYVAGSTTLNVVLPPWVQEGGVASLLARLRDPEARDRIRRDIEEEEGDWDNVARSCGWEGVMITHSPRSPYAEGKTVAQVAEATGKKPSDACFDILLENDGAATCILFMMDEDEVKTIMRHPATIIGSDSLPLRPPAKPHPRANGTFPRVLGKYVREDRVLTLEEAIRKMTSFPARRLGLRGKGLIAEGMDADLVLFDPATVADRATYSDPNQPPVGIEYVIVNGQVVVEHGHHTGRTPGRVLRKGL